MRRPPRMPNAPVLSAGGAVWALVQGFAALLIVAASLYLGLHNDMPEGDLRALVFTTLVLMNVGLIIVNRSFRSSLSDALLRPNPALWTLVGLVTLVLGGALGNVHDRIVYGSVVDFIEVHIIHYHWPDFNIADSAVVIGACLLLLDSFLAKPEESSSNSPENS